MSGALVAITLTITSTSTPSVSGTYNIGGTLESNGIQGEANAVALNGTFADGSEALNWPDIKGVGHSFTVAQFKAFAAAAGLFMAQRMQYAAGLISTAPSSSATIP